ncbi:hypothetical protein EVAR_3755_1 [Eumeta japonica]|uniref:Uncharacterized protein n=1 Tax=Eumeta variegata TaxID=151549 RepID=A0A4C1SSD1_EUMVA|nr:hypothetical protein EVAR_3755_1 [Eumeta japonica]
MRERYLAVIIHLNQPSEGESFQTGVALVSDSGYTFDSEPIPTIVFGFSPILNFGLGPGFDSDPDPVLVSALRSAFNPDSDASHSSITNVSKSRSSPRDSGRELRAYRSALSRTAAGAVRRPLAGGGGTRRALTAAAPIRHRDEGAGADFTSLEGH